MTAPVEPLLPLLPERIPRLWDADERFNDWIMDLRVRQREGLLHFSWDPTDVAGISCVTLASGAVEAQTGINLHDMMLSRLSASTDRIYDSPLSAARVLTKLGVGGLEATLDAMFTVKPMPFLVKGDLGLVPAADSDDEAEQPVGLVVVDPPFYWAATLVGLSKGNMTEVVKGYHIGL